VGFISIVIGFLILVKNWLTISSLIDISIQIQFWVSITYSYGSLRMISSSPYFGFIIGLSCVIAGILITIISSIEVYFLNENLPNRFKGGKGV